MQILVEWALSATKIAITQQVPVFKTGIDTVKSKLQLIENLNQMLSLTGIAMDKQMLKRLLCEISITITYPVKAFAIAHNNNTLKQQVNIPISRLMGMGAQGLINKLQEMHDVIVPLLATLEDEGYNVDAAMLTAMQDAITTFSNAQNSPKQAISTRKSINENINTLVKQTNRMCHDVLDPNSISFKAIDVNYYNEYKIKRKRDNTGVHHTRANVTLKSETGTPFVGQMVTVDELVKDGKTYHAVSGLTDINGYVSVHTFEPGNRTITVSGPGIVTKTYGPFKFMHGKAIVKEFICQPEFNLPAPQDQPIDAVS